MRSLRVEALPTLRIACAGAQTSLITLVYGNLRAVAIAAIVTIVPVIAIGSVVAVGPVVTIAAIITVAVITIAVDTIVLVVTIIAVIIAVPALILIAPPVPISGLVISTITIATLALRVAIISIIAILPVLRLRCHAGRDEYSKNKREARYRPAHPCSEIIFHFELISLSPGVAIAILGPSYCF